MPLESLSFTKVKLKDFKEGESFDLLGDYKICNKYELVRRGNGPNNQPKKEKFPRVEAKFMPEHFSTDNYFKNDRNIDPESEIIITQKIHGTSIRIANTIVRRKKTYRDIIARWFGAKVQESEYDYIFGSRKVGKN